MYLWKLSFMVFVKKKKKLIQNVSLHNLSPVEQNMQFIIMFNFGLLENKYKCVG